MIANMGDVEARGVQVSPAPQNEKTGICPEVQVVTPLEYISVTSTATPADGTAGRQAPALTIKAPRCAGGTTLADRWLVPDGTPLSPPLPMRAISDRLMTSRINSASRKHKSRVFSLLGLVSELEAMFRPLLNKAGLAWHVSTTSFVPANVFGDRWALGRVLKTLCNNAIRFTHTGTISIALDAEEYSDSSIRLIVQVADTGIGMPHDILSQLFGPWLPTGVSTPMGNGANGTGLVMCKLLVEQMEGSLSVTSRPGQGCTFSCSVCVSKVAPHHMQLIDAGDPQPIASVWSARPLHCVLPRRPFVLLVEDHSVCRLIILRYLEVLRCDAIAVCDLDQAVQEISKVHCKHRFDLVILNCDKPWMTDTDVQDAIQRIRGIASEVPVLAMTADAVNEAYRLVDVNTGGPPPVVAHISKPFRLKHLASKINLLYPEYVPPP
jgi:CheY-like chemotaxis protein